MVPQHLWCPSICGHRHDCLKSGTFQCFVLVERLLAAQNPLSQADRPHQLFADAPPPPAGGAMGVPPIAPPPPPPMAGIGGPPGGKFQY